MDGGELSAVAVMRNVHLGGGNHSRERLSSPCSRTESRRAAGWTTPTLSGFASVLLRGANLALSTQGSQQHAGNSPCPKRRRKAKKSKTTERPQRVENPSSAHPAPLAAARSPAGQQPRKANGVCEWNAAPHRSLPSAAAHQRPGAAGSTKSPPSTANTKGTVLIYGSFQ